MANDRRTSEYVCVCVCGRRRGWRGCPCDMILGQPLATELTELSFALQLCALLHSNIGLPVYTEFIKPGASIDSRHFRTGQKKYFKYSFVLS